MAEGVKSKEEVAFELMCFLFSKNEPVHEKILHLYAKCLDAVDGKGREKQER